MNTDLLYTTREIFKSYSKTKKFSIPPYQRGYKWESTDIERLLDDVNNFQINEDLDLFYCLQNITLIERDETFSVVDGQQRLTTLLIILSYLGEYDLIAERLKYDVREETEDFLKEYIHNSQRLRTIESWDAFLDMASEGGKDYDFQDIFYIFQAYKTVQKWFETHSEQKEEMHAKLLDNLKLIVNLPKNIDEQELFENLNGKRVPLDGADLVRALIITRIAKREVGEIDDNVKHNVMINEHRIKLGLLIDSLDRWWSDHDKQMYFHHFTRRDIRLKGTIGFDDAEHPIDILYKLYSLIYNYGEIDIEYFEQQSATTDFLQKLHILQRTLETWYNDTTLYHLVLYTWLYANESAKESGVVKLTFKNLYELWKSKPRLDFINNLKSRIANTVCFDEILKEVQKYEKGELYVDDSTNKTIAFSENFYDPKLVNICVLLDIAGSKTKIPVEYFKVNSEDKEHIFPQTPIADKVKDKTKQTQILKEYIDIINSNLSADDHIILNDNEIDWDNAEWKESIKTTINDRISKVIPINSLGNMCLLHDFINRKYGNDFFLEKRIDIMRAAQDTYIRPHVYDAFNKSFINRDKKVINMSMMIRWDQSDILQRRKDMILKIYKFLKQE